MIMSLLIPGRATAEGTVSRPPGLVATAYRALGELHASSIGFGSHRGPVTEEFDQRLAAATRAAVHAGVNVIDSSGDARFGCSERAIGRALATLLGTDGIDRSALIISTQGGILPDAAAHAGPVGQRLQHIGASYVRRGVFSWAELAAGIHVLTPRYLDLSIDRSRAALGLDTIDLYLLREPELQLDNVTRPELARRLRAAFATLEAACADGRIARYGLATRNGLSVEADHRQHLDLETIVSLAHDIAGSRHRCAAVQIPYNLTAMQAYTTPTQRGAVPLVRAAELGLFVMTRAPFAGGCRFELPEGLALGRGTSTLTRQQQVLEILRSTAGVGTVVIGMTSSAHIDENCGLLRRPPLPAATIDALFEDDFDEVDEVQK